MEPARAYAHRFYYALLVLSMLLVLFAGWVSVRAAQASNEALAATTQSQRVIEQVNAVMAVYGHTESFGLRWAVSFDEAMWQRFQRSMAELDAEADALVAAVDGNAEQRRRAEALRQAVADRHAHGRKVWPALREGGVDASIALIRTGRGTVLGDRIHTAAAEILVDEYLRRDERESKLQDQLRRAVATVVVAIGLAIVAGLVGTLATAQSRRAWVREREADYQREKAEAASEQKSLFLATMSHEIRTPMNAIFGFSQLLGRRVHDPKALEYVRAIRSSGQALLALINDLLDLSKIEAGRLELHRLPTDLRDLVDSTLSVFAEPAAGKGLRLTADVDPFLPRAVVLDPHRVRQVLMNLVSNAIKYTDRGGVRVHVGATPRDGQRVDVEIRVEDTGVGIDPAQHVAIFEPFHRVVGEGDRIEGTGLGLAIVRRLVELMDGRIAIDSAVGRGATFSVRLPELEVATPAQSATTYRPANANFAALAPARILIVDDVPLNRELLAAYLADAGHELEFAVDGFDAVEKVRSWRPTVVLMDIRMPHLDGRQAAERIRALDEGRRICMVAVTASSMSSDERLLRRVFDGYLRKPVSAQDLYDCLLELVGTRRNPEGCSLEVQNAPQRHAEAEAPLTPGQRRVAAPVVQELERLLLARLPHVKSTMRMRELKVLAEDLAGMGERGELPRIAALADRLRAAVEAFDMTTIDSLLDQLPRHVAAERDRLENR